MRKTRQNTPNKHEALDTFLFTYSQTEGLSLKATFSELMARLLKTYHFSFFNFDSSFVVSKVCLCPSTVSP